MDDIRPEKDLVLKFIRLSHELLLECAYVDTFLFQWMEILEDIFDFHPLFFSVPISGHRKVFTNDSRLEEKMKPYENSKVLPGALLDGLFVSMAGTTDHAPVFSIPEELENHSLFDGFQEHAPFFLQQILRLDQLSRKLRLSRFQTEMVRLFEESPRIEDLLDLLDTALQNDVVFVYEVQREVLHFPEEIKEELRDRTKGLFDLFPRVVYERNLFSSEDHEEDFRNLILYPLFNDEDVIAILGSYSSKGGTVF